MSRFHATSAVVVVLSVAAGNVSAQVQYAVTDLGALLSLPYSYALGINASGQVVGYSEAFNDNSRAFLYSNGTMISLGTLGGLQSCAEGINASGQIVGYATTSTGYEHAFLYSNGTMTDVGSSMYRYGSNSPTP